MMAGIYKITCRSNGKIYIGYTNCFKKRWREHQLALRRNRHENSIITRCYAKYGLESFTWEIIEIIHSDDKDILLNMLEDREIFYIQQYRSFEDKSIGMNLTAGGRKMGGSNNPHYGRKHSLEARKKISEAQKLRVGPLNSMWGKKLSLDARNKIKESRKKYVGINHPRYGKKMSPESLSKMTRSHRDRKTIPRELESPDGEIVFVYSVRDFCEQYNLEYNRLMNVLMGTTRSYNGYSLPRSSPRKPKDRRKIYLVDSSNTLHIVDNLAKFCRERGVPPGGLDYMLRGLTRVGRGYRRLEAEDLQESPL